MAMTAAQTAACSALPNLGTYLQNAVIDYNAKLAAAETANQQLVAAEQALRTAADNEKGGVATLQGAFTLPVLDPPIVWPYQP